MAGHSHWAGIKRKKAITDDRRGKAFVKLIRAIEVAAREGSSSNPEINMSLASAIQRAKTAGVQAPTIEKAAKRGAGELNENVIYERVVYEGYGPVGVALLVEASTENRNRTSADVRAVFQRGGGHLGEPGSVGWMFERKGVVVLPGRFSEDEVLLAAADAGAGDATQQGDSWEVTCEMVKLKQVRDALEQAGLEIESAELQMVPNTTVEVDEAGARKVIRLLEALEDLDDVDTVYPNFDAPEHLLTDAQ